MFNCSRKSSLFLLLLTVLVASYPSGDDSSEDDNANNSESDLQQVVDELERRASRNTKCPGCKTLLSAHTWGAPSRLCVGEETVASNSDTRKQDTLKSSKAIKTKKKSMSKSRSTKHTTDLTPMSIRPRQSVIGGRISGTTPRSRTRTTRGGKKSQGARRNSPSRKAFGRSTEPCECSSQYSYSQFQRNSSPFGEPNRFKQNTCA